MIQIRQNVFETNSSSSHSIVVAKNAKSPHVTSFGPYGYATYEDGILRMSEDNNFGWGWEVLTTWLDKFAYAVADFQYEEDKLTDLLEAVQQRLGCDEIVVPRRTLWNDESKTEPDYGYVDHQSAGTLREFLLRKEVDVLDFIFDDRYIIILDNDNNSRERYSSYIEKLEAEDEFPAECWW